MKNVAAKIARVFQEVNKVALEKRGKNDHFHYTFIKSEDVLEVVREAMVNVGLVLLPSATEYTKIDGLGKNKDQTNTIVKFIFTFIDPDSGEAVDRTWLAEGQDGQDKGINKAATAAEKYFLLKTFLLSAGDDQDPDGARPSASRKPTAQKPAAQKPAAQKVEKAPVALVYNANLPPVQVSEALTFKSPGGKEFKDLSNDQLVTILGATNSSVTKEDKGAAQALLIARKVIAVA